MTQEYIFISQSSNSISDIDAFNAFLASIPKIQIKDDEIIFLGKELAFHSSKYKVNKQNIFSMDVSLQGDDKDNAETLELFDSGLYSTVVNNADQFTLISVQDDISAFYAKELYPQISDLERLLRKVVYIVMIRTLGDSWFKYAPKDVIQQIIDMENRDLNKEKKKKRKFQSRIRIRKISMI